jgi:hypothetical protein
MGMSKKQKTPPENSNMVRRDHFLSQDQAAWLKEQSKKDDLSKAYLVRAAIRFYAEKKFGVKLAPEPEE